MVARVQWRTPRPSIERRGLPGMLLVQVDNARPVLDKELDEANNAGDAMCHGCRVAEE